MKIAVRDGHVVGNNDTFTQGDPVGAHEDGTHEDAVVADLDEAVGLHVELGPGVDVNPVSQAQP